MGLWRDLQHAARNLRRTPGFTTVAALTLALGIAAATTMWSVVEAVLLRPLSFAAPERLVDISETLPPGAWHGAVSTPDLADFRQQARSFTAIGGYTTWPGFSLSSGDRPERLAGVRIAPSVLATLGVPALRGRLFVDEEASDGRDRVLILGEALWRSRFGAAPDIIGRKLTVNGEPRTVVGVVPAWLHFPTDKPASQLFVPLVPTSQQRSSRGNHWQQALARLRPGATLAQAQAEMDAVASRLRRQYPDTNEARGVLLTPLRGRLTESVRQPLWILLGAVGLLLAIACANVANLLLARGAARWRETALRTSLGASRWHLARRFLAEGLVLALLGAAAALPLVWVGLHSLLALAPANLPRRGDISLDGGALAFSLAAACVTGLLFSLAPMWQAGSLRHSELLKAGARASTGVQGRRLRNLLVVGEMALSLLLLVGAGLLLRSLWNLSNVDPGLHTEGVLTAELALPEARYTHDRVDTFYRRLDARMAALPGVAASGMISLLPLRTWGWNSDLAIVGAPPLPASAESSIETRSVSPGYFRTMGVGLVRGRLLADSDDARAPQVVVLNEAAARRFWHGADPLGVMVKIGGDTPFRVVGLVRSVHNAGLDRPPLPEAYFPYLQQGMLNMTVVLRTADDPAALAPALRRLVREQDREVPLDNITAMTDVAAASIGSKRFQALLLGVFAGLAASLAAIGLYGLLAYAVVQRRQEIGVRMALGATEGAVRSLVVREGLRLVLPGLALGLAAALGLRRLLATLLFGVAPLDPPTLAAVALGLAAVALLACLVPAARAVRVDPLAALRED